MGKTKIEWVKNHDGSQGFTWNPIRARNKTTGGSGHYCEKVSLGCAHCYAERMQPRFGNNIDYNKADRDKVDLYLDEAVLTQPLRWKKPRMVFPCSMTDLFGPWVPDEWIEKVFAVMAMAKQHTFQVLTKRPERMAAWFNPVGQVMRRDFVWSEMAYITKRTDQRGPELWPLPNVWLGVSVENQDQLTKRLPHLISCPAAIRFLSCEPLLGPVYFANAEMPYGDFWNAHLFDTDKSISDYLHLVIIGGEFGIGARPCDLAWVRSMVEQCKDAGAPCFVKQLGSKPYVDYYTDCDSLREWALDHGTVMQSLGREEFTVWDHQSFGQPHPNSRIAIKLKDPKGGDMTEWPEDLRIREMPKAVG